MNEIIITIGQERGSLLFTAAEYSSGHSRTFPLAEDAVNWAIEMLDEPGRVVSTRVSPAGLTEIFSIDAPRS